MTGGTREGWANKGIHLFNPWLWKTLKNLKTGTEITLAKTIK
jgi:hypothetical protein